MVFFWFFMVLYFLFVDSVFCWRFLIVSGGFLEVVDGFDRSFDSAYSWIFLPEA